MIKFVALALGAVAAVLWFASAVASAFALRVKLDLGSGPTNGDDGGGFRVSSTDDGRGEVVVNGILVPSFGELQRYQNLVTRRNMVAAGLNGLAALSASVAAVLAFVLP